MTAGVFYGGVAFLSVLVFLLVKEIAGELREIKGQLAQIAECLQQKGDRDAS